MAWSSSSGVFSSSFAFGYDSSGSSLVLAGSPFNLAKADRHPSRFQDLALATSSASLILASQTAMATLVFTLAITFAISTSCSRPSLCLKVPLVSIDPHWLPSMHSHAPLKLVQHFQHGFSSLWKHDQGPKAKMTSQRVKGKA